MSTINAYEILGISRTASQDEIKAAYRNLAKKHHPDLNPGNKEAEKKFKDINLAYEMIGTPEQRAKFDRGELDEQAAGAGPGFHEQGFRRGRARRPFYHETQGDAGGRYTFSFGEGLDEDILSSIFGAGAAGPRRGTDEIYRLDVDLGDAVHGAQRELALPDGRRFSVKIPPGVTSGTKLRFAGQGGQGVQGGPRGDLYVEIHIRPSEQFQVEGDDLVMSLPVSLTDAVLGGEVKVLTVDGPVLLSIPPRVNADSRLRLAGKGLFNRSTKKRGDQIVSVKIVLPEQLDPEVEAAIRHSSERRKSA